jgi:hypothetical protein
MNEFLIVDSASIRVAECLVGLYYGAEPNRGGARPGIWMIFPC